MDQKPSTSKERIIPVTIEQSQSEGNGNENEKKNCIISIKHLTINSQNKESESDNINDNNMSITEKNNEIIERSLPYSNTKEIILIILDRAQDDSFTHFKIKNNDCRPLIMLKRSIEFFLHSKHSINNHHEYSLMVLNENDVTWIKSFSNNINQIINNLNNTTECETEDIFDLNKIFDLIIDQIPIPTSNNELSRPPDHMLRAILFYGRSYTMPQINRTEKVNKLLNSPYFTFDVLMTHEPVGTDNNCNKIFDVLQNLDKKGFAYFFSVERDVKMLHCSIAKLLSHPLQRPIQKLAKYKINF